MTHEIEIKADLRELFGPVRDQGARPTCLAFAASDTHAGLRDGWAPLSCEFAFYQAQRRAGRPPGTGAVLASMLAALRFDGQPQEQGWPYLAVVPGGASAWAPPATVGRLYGRGGAAAGQAIEPILSFLDGGRPLIILTMLSQSFFAPQSDGVVTPTPDEQPEPAQRHALVAVGHGVIDGRPSLLVRNSWGPSWGLAGHAWLTEDFLKPRLFGAATLMEDVDVSAHSAAA